MSVNPAPTRHYTETGRIVYQRKRHFFTQKDITRILYNIHDSNHQDIIWELLNLLNLEARILLDTLISSSEKKNFLSSLFAAFFSQVISPFLGEAFATIWDILQAVGLTRPDDSI